MKQLLFIILILSGFDLYAISVKLKIITKHSGRGIPYVIVKINYDGQDKTIKGGYSDDNGLCQFDSLPVGLYDIKTSMIGYPSALLKSVTIKSDTTIVIELDNNCKYNYTDSKICPRCNDSIKVIPIRYGLVIRNSKRHRKLNNRRSKVYYGGCIVTGCDPHWYCKKHRLKF